MLRISPRPMRSVFVRIDSDRDALPFPEGGVRGSTHPETADITSHVISQLDRVQQGFDRLVRQLDDNSEADLRDTRGVIGRIYAKGSVPPPAAA